MAAPAEWEAAWSVAEQRWFFQDRIAGVAAWDRPLGCTIDLPVEPPALELRGGHSTKQLPRDWERAWDAALERHFYFNRGTGERSWHPPQPESDLWQAVWSKSHKRWFYSNALSGVIVEDRPPGCTFALPSEPLQEKSKTHEEVMQEEIQEALRAVQEAGGYHLLGQQFQMKRSAAARVMSAEADLAELGHAPPAVPLLQAAAIRRETSSMSRSTMTTPLRSALGSRSHSPVPSSQRPVAAELILPAIVPSRREATATAVASSSSAFKHYFKGTMFQPARHAPDPVAAPHAGRPYKPGDQVSLWSLARGEWLDAAVVIAAPMASAEQPVIVEFVTPEGKCRKELKAGHEHLRPSIRAPRPAAQHLKEDADCVPPGVRRKVACPEGSRCRLRGNLHLATEAHPFDDDYLSLCKLSGLEAEERSLRSLFAWLTPTGGSMQLSRQALQNSIPLLTWLHMELKNPNAPWEHLAGDNSAGVLHLGAQDWRQLDPGGTGLISFDSFAEWAAPLLGLPLRAPPWGYRTYLPGYEKPELEDSGPKALVKAETEGQAVATGSSDAQLRQSHASPVPMPDPHEAAAAALVASTSLTTPCPAVVVHPPQPGPRQEQPPEQRQGWATPRVAQLQPDAGKVPQKAQLTDAELQLQEAEQQLQKFIQEKPEVVPMQPVAPPPDSRRPKARGPPKDARQLSARRRQGTPSQPPPTNSGCLALAGSQALVQPNTLIEKVSGELGIPVESLRSGQIGIPLEDLSASLWPPATGPPQSARATSGIVLGSRPHGAHHLQSRAGRSVSAGFVR